MRRAIATTTVPGDLAEKMRAAAVAGFDGVEIFENDFLYFDRSPAEVRALAADLGLEIVAWQPFRDFEALPAPLRQKAFERAERKFDLMEALAGYRQRPRLRAAAPGRRAATGRSCRRARPACRGPRRASRGARRRGRRCARPPRGPSPWRVR